MTNGYSKLPRKKTLFKNNKGLGLEVHDIVLENFIESRIFNKKNTMFKTKIKDALVDKKAIADFQSEDPFVGIYFEDLIEVFSEQIKECMTQNNKTMDYKKKYEEALKKAKSIYIDATKEHCTHTDWLENIFPELAKSDDEKIREGLLALLKELVELGGVAQDTWSLKECQQYISWLEKQGEQKPDWSEEDELMIKDAIHWINEFQKSNRCKNENDMQNSVTCEDWLYSLIDRVQPQPNQEWSEEDESHIGRILSYLESFKAYNAPHIEPIKKEIDWLKSLKPHWKPSEFQMKWLSKAIPQPDTELGNEMEYALKSLYEDLQKL